MQIQAVNKVSIAKYSEFVTALNLVRDAIARLERWTNKMPARVNRSSSSWRVPEKDEIDAAAKKAGDCLQALHAAAKKYEVELVSKTWRV